MDIVDFAEAVRTRSTLGFHVYSDFTNTEHIRGEVTIMSVPVPGRDSKIPVTDGFFAVLRSNGEAIFVMEADLVAPPRFSDATFEAEVRLDATPNCQKMRLSVEDVIAYVDVRGTQECHVSSDIWCQTNHGVSTGDFLKGFITEHKVTRSETLKDLAKQEMEAAGVTVEDMRKLGMPEEFLKDLGIVD